MNKLFEKKTGTNTRTKDFWEDAPHDFMVILF